MATFTVNALDVGPDDLAAQLPVTAQLRRMIPGPDRPDYCLAVASAPIRHRTTIAQLTAAGVALDRIEGFMLRAASDGSAELTIGALVLAARVVGQQVHQGMTRFPVNLAYVLNREVLTAPVLDFSLCLPIGVGLITDRSAPPGQDL